MRWDGNISTSPRLTVRELLAQYFELDVKRITIETTWLLSGGVTKVLARNRMRALAEFSVIDPATQLYLRRDNLVALQSGLELSRLGTYVVSWRDSFDEATEEFWVYATAAISLYVREVVLE